VSKNDVERRTPVSISSSFHGTNEPDWPIVVSIALAGMYVANPG
jgi:hypothetical protein